MLKEGSFIKAKYRKLFIASVLGWVVSFLGDSADSLIAGITLDSEAVSAVGLIAPLLCIISFLALLIGGGCATIYSRTLGAFQEEKSKKIAGMGVTVSIAVGVVLYIGMFLLRGSILNFYGLEGRILSLAGEYYNSVMLFSLMTPALWALYYLVAYDGDEVVILATDITMAVGNAVLSFAFVGRFGIAGLGYGSEAGYALGFIVLGIHFLRKTNSIHFKLYFSWKEMIEMIKVSSAWSLLCLYIGIVDIVFNKIVIYCFSEEYLPAYAIINLVLNLALILKCAIEASISFVTVAYGENNPYSVRRIMKMTSRYTFWVSAVVTFLMEVVAGYLPVVYDIEDPAVFEAAVFAARIIPVFFIPTAFVFCYQTYYSSIDRIIEGNLLCICYQLIGPLVIAVPLALNFDFKAMSIGFAATPIFAIVLTLIYIIATGKWHIFPVLVEETDEKEAHFEIKMTQDNIVDLTEKVRDFLMDEQLDKKLVNSVRMVLEDALLMIMNKNKKKVICETVVLVNDEHVRVIMKDNGVIFDLLQEAEDAVSFQAYILSQVVSRSHEASNTTTISFNRNVCVWERS